MNTIQEPHVRCKDKTVSIEYRSWVFEHMPEVGRLLDALDAGSTPNFLDIMAALSELVAFYTEGDLNQGCESTTFSEMSGKRCRFCC